ncbi:SDR family oxidoreductase [Kribbella solani]|uniref:SDR family NAD(P)-dependent oxidoreductase n=1 Tax=Kribbella solani TaxID=236067 RepID=UPI0029B20222|nr:SDR family oxidoreductase [Kribbella solani]MDX2969878.1 SDR family oxidoreductase [Kribbella solani]MDX2969894.1 SDR family oxidoreductase [Kribbella solani]MDX3004050.1 SDR family oxidoreductase [Kribbella solani]
MRLSGKRALVIGGGGGGIGRATTEALGNEGASVLVADFDPDRAAAAAAAVRSAGGTAYPVSGDVRSAADLDAMIAAAVQQLGGLDVLVTVVGGQVAFVPAVKLHEMADEDWDTIYEVNLKYVARAVRAALRVFLDQGTGGTIVSVGSVTGFMAAPEQAAYGVMKAGLLSLARTVAAEYARDGIRMNIAAAGAIATAVANAGEGTEVVEEIPVGRLGRSEEVAQAVVYLASDAAAYVTGQQLVLDGGVSVRGPFQ